MNRPESTFSLIHESKGKTLLIIGDADLNDTETVRLFVSDTTLRIEQDRTEKITFDLEEIEFRALIEAKAVMIMEHASNGGLRIHSKVTVHDISRVGA